MMTTPTKDFLLLGQARNRGAKPQTRIDSLNGEAEPRLTQDGKAVVKIELSG
jgi:hypothetical protein